jgi:hypothetical protein
LTQYISANFQTENNQFGFLGGQLHAFSEGKEYKYL